MGRTSLILSVSALAMLALGVGCNSNEASAFPAGLAVVGENSVPLPEGTAEDAYPETLNQQRGDGSPNWSNARAYVQAPIDEVWDALKMPEVLVDRREAARYSVEWNVEPEYPVSFVNHIEVDDIITIKYKQTWRQGSSQNSTGGTVGVIATYQKTWGTTYIRQMYGSIELIPVTDDVTEISFVQRMSATQTTSEEIASWQRDMYASIVAVVHGRPLPTY
jgi:hypothetical protein